MRRDVGREPVPLCDLLDDRAKATLELSGMSLSVLGPTQGVPRLLRPKGTAMPHDGTARTAGKEPGVDQTGPLP